MEQERGEVAGHGNSSSGRTSEHRQLQEPLQAPQLELCCVMQQQPAGLSTRLRTHCLLSPLTCG